MTKENLLLINTLSKEIPLNGTIAFSECSYPIDLSRFTDTLTTRINQMIQPRSQSQHASIDLQTELNTEDPTDFAYNLTIGLNMSDYDSLIIEDPSEDPSETSRCIVSKDDGELAIAGPKIDPKNVFLFRSSDQSKISLMEWAEQKIWNYRKRSTLQSIVKLLERLNPSAQAHLPIEQSQPKQGNCQSDSPQYEPYP